MFAGYVKNKKQLDLMFYGILLIIIAISTVTVQLIQCHDKVCERTSRSKVSLGPGIFPIHFFKRWITPDVLLIKKYSPVDVAHTILKWKTIKTKQITETNYLLLT